MTDIVERLRTAASNNRIQAERGTTTTGEILTALGCQTKEAVASMHDDAADEITRLRSLNKELTEARDDAVAAAMALKNVLDRPITQSEIDAAVALARQIRPQMDEAAARAALKKAGIQ